MNARTRVVRLLAGCVLCAAFAAWGQAPPAPPPSVIPADGISDVGSLEAVPFGGTGQLLLKPEEKAAMRKLEDKHIQELRTLEDRFEKELRALRAKQYVEREQFIKSIARR